MRSRILIKVKVIRIRFKVIDVNLLNFLQEDFSSLIGIRRKFSPLDIFAKITATIPCHFFR
jgi:hypothetical protein